jgi:hypothetical protein
MIRPATRREQESKQYKTKSEHRERESDWLAFPDVDKFPDPDSAAAVARSVSISTEAEVIVLE